jgi:hypothetical protein
VGGCARRREARREGIGKESQNWLSEKSPSAAHISLVRNFSGLIGGAISIMPYTVSQVQEKRYMAGTKRGYGFDILDARGAPVCEMVYANKDDADRGRDTAQKMIESAVS